MPGSWPQVSNTTLQDQVYELIRDRILAGDFAPGEFIRELEVGEGVGVSRTPVREALGRLASEGFLERIPHRGFRVPQESVDSLLELYPIVATLEVLAARTSLPGLDHQGLARLRELNEQMKVTVAMHEARRGIELNHEFHHLLSQKCGNRTLCELLDDLRSRVVRLEMWSFHHISHTEESLAQHEEIIDCIEAGHYQRALAVLERNRLQTYTKFHEELGERVAAKRGTASRDGAGEERAQAAAACAATKGG